MSDKNIRNGLYIGEIFLNFSFIPKSKYIIFGIDIYHSFEFTQKILNEWASIGIQHRPCKEYPSDNVNIYYELWVEDEK